MDINESVSSLSLSLSSLNAQVNLYIYNSNESRPSTGDGRIDDQITNTFTSPH